VSEVRVLAAIEQMEAWLADPAWDPDPEVLAQWTAEFQGALTKKEQGPDWSELVARAHAAGKLLEVRLAGVMLARDQVRAELKIQARGAQALKGYRSSRP